VCKCDDGVEGCEWATRRMRKVSGPSNPTFARCRGWRGVLAGAGPTGVAQASDV
jgi:hypothetical protein